MLNEGFADAFAHGWSSGEGDAMRLALVGDDIDQIVIAQHIGKFKQRPRHFEIIIGELDHDGTRSPGQRRTRTLIRTAVPLVDRLVRMSRLPGMRGVVGDITRTIRSVQA